MNLYACGGCAANIASKFTQYHQQKNKCFAELQVFFVDTSRSNLNSDIPSECVYLVDNVDGSGKKRDSNYHLLAESSQEILHKFRPADVNVVLHSTAGGTGSTIGPILVSELLSRGESVIVITVGSSSSKIEVENTIKTLKSYEVISQKRNLPVVVHYKENTHENPRGHVDGEIQTAILTLSAIFSGDNKELDSSDLKNFINYHKVTSYGVRLSYLDFFSGEIVLGKGHSLVSLVTLVDETTLSDVTIPVEYQAVGYLLPSTKEMVSVRLPIHATVITGYFNAIIDSLEHKLTNYGETRKIAVEKSIAKEEDIEHTDIGIVL
jgi:hypothetical protein